MSQTPLKFQMLSTGSSPHGSTLACGTYSFNPYFTTTSPNLRPAGLFPPPCLFLCFLCVSRLPRTWRLSLSNLQVCASKHNTRCHIVCHTHMVHLCARLPSSWTNVCTEADTQHGNQPRECRITLKTPLLYFSRFRLSPSHTHTHIHFLRCNHCKC